MNTAAASRNDRKASATGKVVVTTTLIWLGATIAASAVVAISNNLHSVSAAYLQESVNTRLADVYQLLADDLAAGLRANDATVLGAVLRSVPADRHITRVRVVDVNGQRYAGAGADETTLSMAVPDAGFTGAGIIDGDLAVTSYPLNLNRQKFGSLWLETRLTETEAGLRFTGVLLPWVVALLLGLIVIAAISLQRLVYRLRDASQLQIDSERRALSLRKAVEEANQAKNRFHARMSHELRTPLNVVLGFAQIQKSQLPADAPAFMIKNTNETLAAGWQLLHLIEDIFDISRLEERKLAISMENCTLAEVVSHAISLVSVEADEAGINLQYEDSPLLVHADYTRLKQVLVNLLSNAIKTTTVGGKVSFRARELAQGGVECVIVSAGISSVEPDTDAVFELFAQANDAQDDIPGTAIGLTLAGLLVDLMGGKMRFAATGDEAAIYYLSLNGEQPVATLPLAQDQATLASGQPEQSLSVVYVEDHRASLELMKAIMDPFRHVTLLTATTAEEGIELARQHRPDLMLLDINLHGMDGVTAARHIRSMPELAHMTLVALSADAVESNIETALSAGFAEYLTKPLDIDKLWQLIGELQYEKRGMAKEVV